MPTLTRGDVVSKGLNRYKVERVMRSKEYAGEKLYMLRGQWAAFGPFDVETIYGNGYKLEKGATV